MLEAFSKRLYATAMPSFSQLRDMYRLQREAKKVKKELSKIHIEAEGRFCKIVVTAEQEVVSVDVRETSDPAALGADLKDVFNRAMKKAQVVSAEKMQPIMGEMGMPTA